MLKKLIKYDLVSFLKFISIFYIIGIIFALFTRIFFSIENSLIAEILGQISTGTTIAIIINILINNLMRFWIRFKNTLYDDESYLTHTLPVSKKTIFLSKIFTSLIIMIISFIVIGLLLFIAYYSKENIELLKNLMLPLTSMLNSSFIKLLLILITLVFLELFTAILCGCIGIILGHKTNNHKISNSVLFGFLAYIINQTLVLIVIAISSLINSDLMTLFTSSTITDVNLLKQVVIITTITYSILIIINVFVSIKLFNKGVNVD